eukprot:IDg7013t1
MFSQQFIGSSAQTEEEDEVTEAARIDNQVAYISGRESGKDTGTEYETKMRRTVQQRS